MRCASAFDMISFIYPGVDTVPPPPPDYFLNRMILAPRNTDVNDMNTEILGRMAGEPRTYFSADKIIEEAGADGDDNYDDRQIPIEFLRSLNASSLPPGELTLKIGCPLICLRNLAPARGLCNGTRMVLLRMSERVLEVRLVGGDHDGEIAFIPRISLTPTNSTDFTFKFSRRQFPVRLAFALTINKSQGQSVKFVGLDLRVPVFSHGQLYVALSRATSEQRIKVLLPDNTTTNETVNVVYPEVLLD
jgi:ATP-dependent exoDNAse (exonuclease V) alpha subunit